MAVARPDPRTLDRAAYPFSIALPTRFGDLDVNFHLNNVAATSLIQEARIRFFDWLGAPPDGDASRWLVASMAVTFLAEGRYPEDTVGYVGVSRLGRTSVSFAQLLTQGDATIAHAEVALVLSNKSGPTPIDGALRARVEAARLRGVDD